MSWHCLICGSSENCAGLIEVFHIGGGIPTRSTIHLKCLADAIEKAVDGRHELEITDQWRDTEKENDENARKLDGLEANG